MPAQSAAPGQRPRVCTLAEPCHQDGCPACYPKVATWCGHTGRYQVTAILCGRRGWSDRMMRCETCGREYLASELAAYRTGHQHTQPRGAKPPAGAIIDHPAHERAGPTGRTGSMNAPITPTGHPEAAQPGELTETKAEDLGEGHIMGNLTQDPELRFTPTGRAVARLRLAYTPRAKNPETGRWADGETEFYDLQVWGKQGERCAEFLRRGDRVVAAGTYTRRTWQGRDGLDHQTVELTVKDIGPSMLFRGVQVNRDEPAKDGASND